MYDTTKRKWHLNMTPQEVYAVRGAVLKYNNWVFSPHSLEEMKADRVSAEDVQKVLKYGKVFEVHNCDAKDLCALLRFTIKNRSVAVVVSLCKGVIVTVFANTVESGMRRPDMANYKWQADLSTITYISPDNLTKIK